MATPRKGDIRNTEVLRATEEFVARLHGAASVVHVLLAVGVVGVAYQLLDETMLQPEIRTHFDFLFDARAWRFDKTCEQCVDDPGVSQYVLHFDGEIYANLIPDFDTLRLVAMGTLTAKTTAVEWYDLDV